MQIDSHFNDAMQQDVSCLRYPGESISEENDSAIYKLRHLAKTHIAGHNFSTDPIMKQYQSEYYPEELVKSFGHSVA